MRGIFFLFVFSIFCPLVAAEELWSGGEYPVAEQLHRFKNIRFVKVKPREPEKDTFVWQHGAAIIRYKDKFYASLGANAGHENTVGEKILITQSDDGVRWTPCRIIGDATATDVGRSHGVFLEQGGKLWSFHSLFKKKGTPGAVGGAFPDLAMEAFVLNETTGDWENKGVVAKGIWPLHEPIKMADGNWIVAGCDEDWRAAVAISEGDNLLRWNSTKVRNKDRWFTESNLWIDGSRLTLLIRDDRPSDPKCNHPALAFSDDYGKTWSVPVECNMPMTSSKPACGVLSTGQRFLVNTLVKTQGSRGSLEIAVGRPGEKTLSKVWRIREVREPVPEGAFQPASFSYPHATEYNGNLYIIYSVGAVGAGGNNNHIELAVIPIAELNVN